LLADNPFLKKSYEEQFIAGGNYSFTYNEQVIERKKIQYFLHFTAEAAGNFFSLAELIAGNKPNRDNPSTIAGSIYSQYAKLSVDGRAYYNFKDDNKIALRVFAGMANSYGNSSTLPYSKQFSVAGRIVSALSRLIPSGREPISRMPLILVSCNWAVI